MKKTVTALEGELVASKRDVKRVQLNLVDPLEIIFEVRGRNRGPVLDYQVRSIDPSQELQDSSISELMAI